MVGYNRNEPPATFKIMVWADRPSHTGLSPNTSTMMHASAYISVPTPIASPFSCSGG